MKRVLSVLLLAGLVTNLQAQSKVVIKGTVKGDLKGFNKVYLFGDNVNGDATEIKNGTFSFSFPWKVGASPFIYSEYDSAATTGGYSFPIVVDGPGTVNLKIADVTKGFISGTITGNKSAAAFHEFDKGQRTMQSDLLAELGKRFPGKGKSDSVFRKAFSQERIDRMIPYVSNFVEAHAAEYVGAFVLLRYKNMLPDENVEKLFAKLSAAMQASIPGKEVRDHLSGMKRSGLGNLVDDFTLSTPVGDSISFSSFRGKYVMVDFWSSWCGPCKASFPHMKEVYQKYQGKNFEILGISIDEEKAAWLKEIDKQRLPWPQVLDTKKIYVTSFGVTGVPTAFLISPEGKILLKEIGFDKHGNSLMEKKLKELFDK
ncbi:AhpC/TSA family protein [Pseudoflavitalea sp. G-6-1-2]|uniref:TlpA disulfide reductase family protein n=1 Tax=Pseudoflavitalea sp. G-6-1-2 TaxID=2728841 RepID=UPI00146E981D|nr:TlpA disulfide reductase family protein [Pseudoflavitalea sp. G-6-1-2]NML22734.1 AhpC/TSA family protein [Pseudoflavitalea sp. G-6-1-2]